MKCKGVDSSQLSSPRGTEDDGIKIEVGKLLVHSRRYPRTLGGDDKVAQIKHCILRSHSQVRNPARETVVLR